MRSMFVVIPILVILRKFPWITCILQRQISCVLSHAESKLPSIPVDFAVRSNNVNISLFIGLSPLKLNYDVLAVLGVIRVMRSSRDSNSHRLHRHWSSHC
jgi:hypothetical protein